MKIHPGLFSRRKFLTTSAGALAVSSIFNTPSKGNVHSPSLTINDVIQMVKKEAEIDTLKDTVDTIKIGDGAQVVKGIVTTMFPTVEVIRKTIDMEANFIIAHEPSFYNHADETQWLEDDEVFKYKRDLLSKHKIVIWRLHDYIHAFQEDGILMGVLEAMDWKKYYDPQNPLLLKMPAVKLGDIIDQSKAKLKIEKLRYIGDVNQLCERICLLPGAWGGRNQIGATSRYTPDLVMCGELSEWETSEYVRDARAMGRKQSLIILGHAVSEEPGMEWLVRWLQPKLPSVKITHVPSKSPFSWA